jgi:hypothetical protein
VANGVTHSAKSNRGRRRPFLAGRTIGQTLTLNYVSGRSLVETWGTLPAERAQTYPCDELIEHPDGALFRGVDAAAPSEMVFRWLCQLRVAPYSYDCIDNLGRRSPRQLVPGLEELVVGQRFMTIFRLVSFEDGRSITLDSNTAAFGRIAVSYAVLPAAKRQSRLVAKIVFQPPRGLVGLVMRHVLPAGDLVMMRKQLVTLKALAEREARSPSE